MRITTSTAIRSRGANGSEIQRGYSRELRTVGGASGIRVIERPLCAVEEHAHDWPVLSLYVMGSCNRRFASGELAIRGPSAVLHPRGEFHSSTVGELGLEQVDIEFDPAWVPEFLPRQMSGLFHRRGGRIGARAQQLAKMWSSAVPSEREIRSATSRLIASLLHSEPEVEPRWLASVQKRLDADTPPTTEELAVGANLSAAWLNQAYRAATGEGLQQALMRRRVARATLLLRETGESAAEIAVQSGFCDQSHMIRTFRRVLGRTPGCVRSEGIFVGSPPDAAAG